MYEIILQYCMFSTSFEVFNPSFKLVWAHQYNSIFRAGHLTHTQRSINREWRERERTGCMLTSKEPSWGAASCNGYYSRISNLVAATDIFRWCSQQPWPMAIKASAPFLVLKKMGKIPLFPTFYNIYNILLFCPQH